MTADFQTLGESHCQERVTSVDMPHHGGDVSGLGSAKVSIFVKVISCLIESFLLLLPPHRSSTCQDMHSQCWGAV